MENISGKSPNGERDRALSIWLAHNEEGPNLHLWVHPPDAGGGWEVRVNESDLKEALERALAAPASAGAAPTGALLDYFQEGRWQKALDRYGRFAQESGWSIGHKLELYGLSKTAFDPAQDETQRREAFAAIYQSLRSYWQVFRGGGSHWDEETAFDFFNTEADECRPTVRSLDRLSRNEMRQVVLPFLDRLTTIQTLSSGAWPALAASRFLHFFNPQLFPMYDNALIHREVLEVFGGDFEGYCRDSGIAEWDEAAAFYGRYMLWAGRHIQLGDAELMTDFAAWLRTQVEEDEADASVLADAPRYYAAAFEFVAIGAAKLRIEG